jgi:hypothetical protein
MSDATPYRTNVRPSNDRASSRRQRAFIALAAAVVVLGAAALSIPGRLYRTSHRKEIALANSRAEARSIQGRAVMWRSAHPLSCPTLTDLGRSDEHDAWQSPYVVECQALRVTLDNTAYTIVRSAGPDGRYLTEDDVVYPQ